MIDVTCFHCGNIVQISPDAERCAKCGANLRRLIVGEQASGYFYHRAADMAGEGNVIAALQEVQRGLSYQPSSELNLLGAILCKRLGHLDQMRHYVAAIPADDVLRGEAEWLLRSNQARQRAPVDPTKSGKAPVALPLVTDADALPMLMEEISPSVHHPRRPPPRRWVRPVLWLSLFTALAFGGWFIWQNPPAELLAALADSDAGAATERNPADGSAPSPVPATGAPADLPAPTLDLGTSPTVTPEEAPGAPSLRLPTPTPPADLVQGALTPEAVAGADARAAVAAANPQRFDWTAYLEQAGRGDLAALAVAARVEGDRLVLEGSVVSVEQRTVIEQLAQAIPGFREVSAVNVTVQLPLTYTVQEGDTLWGISMTLYGDPDMVEELFAANREVMPSAGDLRVGMALQVPQRE